MTRRYAMESMRFISAVRGDGVFWFHRNAGGIESIGVTRRQSNVETIRHQAYLKLEASFACLRFCAAGGIRIRKIFSDFAREQPA